MLKKSLLFAGVLLFPFFAFAASLHFGDYFLKGAEVEHDDVYILGRTSTISGKVEGDVVSFSKSIFSQSDIRGDALFAGDEVRVEGNIGDDVRVVGNRIIIDGTVADDVVAIGSKIVVSPTARIEGSLYAAGADIEIGGIILGDVTAAADTLVLYGTVDGNMELWGRASFRSPARIGGDFVQHVRGKAEAPLYVSIAGKTILDTSAGKPIFRMDSVFGGFVSLKILMMLFLGFALFFLARERMEDVLLDTLSNFWARALRGLLIILLTGVSITILIPSVVGIPLALVLGALLLLLLLLSWASAGMLVGAWCERVFFRRSAFPLSYRPVLLGIIFLSGLSLVPLAGPLFHGILLCASAGSIGTLFFREMRRVR